MKLTNSDVHKLILLSGLLFGANKRTLPTAVATFKATTWGFNCYDSLGAYAKKVADGVIAIYQRDKVTLIKHAKHKDLIDSILQAAYARRWKWVPLNISQAELARQPIELKRLTSLRAFAAKHIGCV